MAQTRKAKNKQKRKLLSKLVWEWVRYLTTGGVWFWSGYLAFFICYSIFDLSLWWSTIISYAVGWSINFILERYWVFSKGKKDELTQVTIRYVIYTALNAIVNYWILDGLKMIGISPYIGQFISAGFFTFWNYYWYKSWVFRSKPIKVPIAQHKKYPKIQAKRAKKASKKRK